jgi:WD40 repeat protein
LAGFHERKINNITTAVAKKIFASCSEDFSVRVWSFYESDSQEKRGLLQKTYKDEPLCVALHPSGMFIAVCF